MKRGAIALSGYYGFDNAGDEAVLMGLVRGLRATAPDVRLTALSGVPSETVSMHGIDARHRYKLAAVMQTLAGSSLLLSGGGSLLQDVTSAHSIFYYLAVVRIAQMMGKKTMFIAQGIGPLNLPRSRKLVASVANKLDAITVRDPDSAALLKAIGVSKHIEVTADPALLLGLDPIPPPSVSNMLGISLRPWPVGMDPASVARSVESSRISAAVRTFDMQPSVDSPAMEQFSSEYHHIGRPIDHLTRSQSRGLSGLISEIASCEMVLAMRLHALILAAANGVPSLALSYDPKVAAFMTSISQADAVCQINSADVGALSEQIASIWRSRIERGERTRSRMIELRQAAMRNAQVAIDLI